MVDPTNASAVRFVGMELQELDGPMTVLNIVEFEIPVVKDREAWIARRLAQFMRQDRCCEIQIQFF